MKLKTTALLFVALSAVSVSLTSVASADSLLNNSFDEDAGVWVGIGGKAAVHITHDAANVKSGKGALAFDYAIAKGDLNALLLPTSQGSLTKLKSLHFWIKSDHTAPYMFTLQEQDGGRYSALFTVPANTWQEVQLAPSDFALDEDKDAPKDPDGKLDLDKVATIGITDLSQFFAQIDDPNLAAIFIVPQGPHSFYFDDFRAGTEPIADPAPAAREVLLDTPTRPQVGWMTFGQAKLSNVTEKPLSGAGLRADYHQAPGKIVGFLRHMPRGKLVGQDRLAFSVASTRPARLLVQIEQVGGGKYNTTIQVPGNSELKELTLPFTDFIMSDDSGDRGGHLDLKRVNQVLIMDASGIVDNADQDNTLWINRLRGAAK